MTSESVLQDVKQGRVKRPKVSLSFLRIVLVLHAALVVMQPIMAGYYLSGEADAMDWHSPIGSDGGLLGAPISHDSLVVAPAERFDVIIDFSAYEVGTELTLLNKLDSGRAGQVMRFKVAREATDDSNIPDRLSSYATTPEPAGVVRRKWRFSRGDAGGHKGWTINGKPFDPSHMHARPRLNEYEIWTFVTDVHHPVHVHLAPFQVLRRGGSEPARTMLAGRTPSTSARPKWSRC